MTSYSWERSTLVAKASDTLEESQGDVLTGGYAYVLDERDEEWLGRNNKTANGEGTSASGAAGTPRGRSAKARGKEPEVVPSVAITEDEFELVMGLFERLTEERLPFLHPSPTDAPPFTDYEHFFSSPPSPHYFPSFSVPESFPTPATLLRLARVIYPHWRERKLERGGRRIIPQLIVRLPKVTREAATHNHCSTMRPMTRIPTYVSDDENPSLFGRHGDKKPRLLIAS